MDVEVLLVDVVDVDVVDVVVVDVVGGIVVVLDGDGEPGDPQPANDHVM